MKNPKTIQENCEQSLKIPFNDFEEAKPLTDIAYQLLKFQAPDS